MNTEVERKEGLSIQLNVLKRQVELQRQTQFVLVIGKSGITEGHIWDQYENWMLEMDNFTKEMGHLLLKNSYR